MKCSFDTDTEKVKISPSTVRIMMILYDDYIRRLFRRVESIKSELSTTAAISPDKYFCLFPNWEKHFFGK